MDKFSVFYFNFFNYYHFQAKIDRLQGADMNALDQKIVQHLGTDDGEGSEDMGNGLVS